MGLQVAQRPTQPPPNTAGLCRTFRFGSCSRPRSETFGSPASKYANQSPEPAKTSPTGFAPDCHHHIGLTSLSRSGPGLSHMLYKVIQACQHLGIESSCELVLLYVRCHCLVCHDNVAIRQHR